MSPIERMLLDDMHRLVDRIAALRPDGIGEALATHPQLRSLIDAGEARLTSLRSDLVDGYHRWQEALEEYEDLWALSALQDVAERVTDRRAA